MILLFWTKKEKDDWLHCVNLATEWGEGWVAKGFVVYAEPVKDGHEYRLTVYMISDDWCLTDQEFVKTEFIDLTVALDIHYECDADEMTWEEDDAA